MNEPDWVSRKIREKKKTLLKKISDPDPGMKKLGSDSDPKNLNLDPGVATGFPPGGGGDFLRTKLFFQELGTKL